jgi:hypothetical protein
VGIIKITGIKSRRVNEQIGKHNLRSLPWRCTAFKRGRVNFLAPEVGK